MVLVKSKEPIRSAVFCTRSCSSRPGTEKILAQHMGIQVNGLVYYPESMGSHLGMMTVNGSRNAYPDGAIVLKRNALIDKVFALRAKERLYWSAKRMVMVAPDLDAEVLVKKGASFAAKEVIISESKVEPLIDRIDEKAELIIVPEGTAVISDDVTLDDILVKKYGKKLYIIGNLTVEDGTLLEQLEYLVIQGDVTVPEAYKTLLVEKAQSITGQVKLPPKGRFISGNASLRVTKWMLEQETDGLTACDCAEVEIAEDISKDLLVNRLTITDCAFVVCPEELQDAVAMICHDVAGIRSESTEGEKKPEDDVTVVNCAEYVM